MIRIAIVGDIGSGKSFIAKLFGYPVFNADRVVSGIYKNDKNCFRKIKKKFPNYVSSFPLKKKDLVNIILQKKENLKIIVKIVHPIVRKKLENFIKRKKRNEIVVLDIPLYLENKLNKKKDIIVFVNSKKKEIIKRLKKRQNYNVSILNKFKKIQLPIEKKRKKSTFIINNNFKIKTAKKYVKQILEVIL
jgi:dephospho-CoA kinase